jgi:hypothetical protein
MSALPKEPVTRGGGNAIRSVDYHYDLGDQKTFCISHEQAYLDRQHGKTLVDTPSS